MKVLLTEMVTNMLVPHQAPYSSAFTAVVSVWGMARRVYKMHSMEQGSHLSAIALAVRQNIFSQCGW